MSASDDPSAAISTLLDARASFLAFVQRRIDDRQAAEDVLQGAFVKALEHRHELRDEERLVAWFYRLLRNAIIDHWRHQATGSRALERAAAAASAEASEDSKADQAELCRCFEALLPDLPEPQAHILRSIDLGGQRPVDYAAAQGITPNNAMVRLHRARKTLRERLLGTCRACARHGCLDCTCQAAG